MSDFRLLSQQHRPSATYPQLVRITTTKAHTETQLPEMLRRMPVLILATILYANSVQTTPLHATGPATPLTARQNASPQCEIEGNSDFYGLGIRLGIYLQWISATLAHFFSPESSRELLATNTIFVLALVIALAISTAHRTVQSVEIVILLQLLLGFVLSVHSIWGLRIRGALSLTKQQAAAPQLSRWGTLARLLLSAAVCFYCAWFWNRGVDSATEDGCEPTTFLFARVAVLGPARTFYRCFSVLLAIISGLAVLSETIFVDSAFLVHNFWAWAFCVHSLRQLLHYYMAPRRIGWVHPLVPVFLLPIVTMNIDIGVGLTRSEISEYMLDKAPQRPNPRDTPSTAETAVPRRTTGHNTTDASPSGDTLPEKQSFMRLALRVFSQDKSLLRAPTGVLRPVYSCFLPFFNIFCLLWSIASTELTIHWNNVSSVYEISSVGQLIPFFTGVFSFALFVRNTVVFHLEVRIFDAVTVGYIQLLDPSVYSIG